MNARWPTLAMLITLGLGASQPAMAQDGKVKKAEKMLARYAGTDHDALAKAYDAIDRARTHPKTRDAAQTWTVLGDIARAYVLDPGAQAPMGDPLVAAIDAYDTAIGSTPEPAQRERILEGVATLESYASRRAGEAFESERHADAVALLEQALRAQQLLRQLDAGDASREQPVLQLAVLANLAVDDLDRALALHAELSSLTRPPVAVTLSVTEAIREAKGPQQALDFLQPHADAAPDDASLLNTRVDAMLALEQTDAVRELLEARAQDAGKALGITRAHAAAWDRVGDLERAAELYERSLELNRGDLQTLRAFADLEVRRADAFEQVASTTRKWRERRDNRQWRDEARARAIDLLLALRELDPNHLDTLLLLRAQWEEAPPSDREELGALDAAIERLQQGG